MMRYNKIYYNNLEGNMDFTVLTRFNRFTTTDNKPPPRAW